VQEGTRRTLRALCRRDFRALRQPWIVQSGRPRAKWPGLLRTIRGRPPRPFGAGSTKDLKFLLVASCYQERSACGPARESQNHVIALQAIARVERQVELEARLLGELNDSAKVAVGISVNTQPAEQKGDLSRLSDDELRQLEILTRKTYGLES